MAGFVSPLPYSCEQQIREAYTRMALEAFYRPAAPSDGYGNILVPEEELDLDAELDRYVPRWWGDESSCEYHIGCPNFPDRKALIYAIEIARLICGQMNGSPWDHIQRMVDLLRDEVDRAAQR